MMLYAYHCKFSWVFLMLSYEFCIIAVFQRTSSNSVTFLCKNWVTNHYIYVSSSESTKMGLAVLLFLKTTKKKLGQRWLRVFFLPCKCREHRQNSWWWSWLFLQQYVNYFLWLHLHWMPSRTVAVHQVIVATMMLVWVVSVLSLNQAIWSSSFQSGLWPMIEY